MSALWLNARTRWNAWTPERYPRLSRAKHAGLAFSIVLLAFVVFRLTAVPLIEPPRRVATNREQRGPDRIHNAVEEQRRRLEIFFQPGDWELDNAKVLETSQGMLILKDYKTLGEGRVEIRPCTVVLLPDDHEQLDNEAKARRAVLMRAPEGAVLQFEEFNIRMARVGKFIGGDLTGEITIHSRQKDPGPEDDLLVRTRDVQLAGNQIVTEAPVSFRLGRSNGSGRLMQIELLPDRANNGGTHGPNVGGINSFKLMHDVKLHLALDDVKQEEKTADPSRTPEKPKEPEPPVEITSRGPFVFDVERRVATFTDHVDVLRLVPDAPSDQLLCETLAVHFSPRGAAAPAANSTSPGKLPKLEPAWIEAFGNPVVARAPSSKIEARGEYLAYDLRTRSGMLQARRQGEQVRVSQAANEIQARELHFAPSATKGELGSFLAIGPGWMRGTLPDQPDEPIEARWSHEARLRPHEGMQVLSVTGRAYVKSFARGDLAADEIHAWLIPGAALPDGTKSKPTPNRLLATGDVKFNSTQIEGQVDRLETYFEQPATIAPANFLPTAAGTSVIQPSVYLQAAQGAGVSAPSPSPIIGATPLTATPNLLAQEPVDAPPAQRFDVRGKNLRIKLILEEPQARLAELVIDQDVELNEIQTTNPDDKPMRLTGDRVHLTQQAPQQSLVTITGRPAHVEAQGMALDAPRIELDQTANLLLAPGAGKMDIFVDRDLDGNPLPEPKPLQVTWQAGMEFDGLIARFHQAEARQEQQVLKANELKVTMQEPINFQRGMADKSPGASNEAPTKLARIDCTGDVHLYQYLYELGQLVAYRELRARDLGIDQESGDLLAHGHGSLQSVQFGSQNPLMENSIAQPPPSTAAPGDKPEKLNFLGVEFAEAITGNMKRKEMTFHHRVQAVYGPVTEMRAKLDPRRFNPKDAESFWLTTDALTVRQGPKNPQGKPTAELETDGDTRIEAQKFNAWASKLTYAQAKDLITLKGDGYTDAVISRIERVGDAPKETRAGTIQYSRANQSVTVGDFQYLDFSEIGGKKKQ